MKIGIDIRAAIEEPAGIGKVVRNLVQQLLTIDAENEYILYSNTSFDPGTRKSGVRVIVTDFSKVPGGRLLWHLVVAIRARFIDRADTFISVSSLQVAALTKDFVVLIVPDITNVLFPQWHKAKPRLTGLLLKRALRNSREIIAISRHTRSDVLRFSGGEIRESKVTVAYIACEDNFRRPVSPEEIEHCRKKYGVTSKCILSVGTIEPRKNLPALIEAFAGIAGTPGDLELVLVGRKGWKWQETFDTAERSGVKERIRFLVNVTPEDLPALYAAAELFVYPSFYEGFGIPPLEAMTCGIPVITSNTSSLPEVVGEAAILIPPTDRAALRDAMRNVLTDQELRQRLSRLGRQQSTKFSWEAFGKNVLERITLLS